MARFRKYEAGGGRYDIFRGKSETDTWFVYDVQEKRYVGGEFSTLAAAKAWVCAQ